MIRSTKAILEGVIPQNTRMALVRLRVPALQPGSLNPGAVAVVGVPGIGDSYFALASSPDVLPRADVLLRCDAPVAGALAALPQGSTIRVEGPVGAGFDVDRLVGRSVALIGVGTAMGPLRSALEYMIARRGSYGRLALVYGVRDPDDFCCLSEHDVWRAAGVELHLVVSRPPLAGWEGRSGRVQLHLDEALAGFGDAGALVCGMPVMMEETIAALGHLGYAREDVLVNY